MPKWYSRPQSPLLVSPFGSPHETVPDLHVPPVVISVRSHDAVLLSSKCSFLSLSIHCVGTGLRPSLSNSCSSFPATICAARNFFHFNHSVVLYPMIPFFVFSSHLSKSKTLPRSFSFEFFEITASNRVAMKAWARSSIFLAFLLFFVPVSRKWFRQSILCQASSLHSRYASYPASPYLFLPGTQFRWFFLWSMSQLAQGNQSHSPDWIVQSSASCALGSRHPSSRRSAIHPGSSRRSARFVWSKPLPARSTPGPVVPVLLHVSANGDSSLAGRSARDSVARDSVGDCPDETACSSVLSSELPINDSALLLRDDGIRSISGSLVVSRLISSSSSDSIGTSCGNLSCCGAIDGVYSPSLSLSSSCSSSWTVGNSFSTSTYPCWPLPTNQVLVG